MVRPIPRKPFSFCWAVWEGELLGLRSLESLSQMVLVLLMVRQGLERLWMSFVSASPLTTHSLRLTITLYNIFLSASKFSRAQLTGRLCELLTSKILPRAADCCSNSKQRRRRCSFPRCEKIAGLHVFHMNDIAGACVEPPWWMTLPSLWRVASERSFLSLYSCSIDVSDFRFQCLAQKFTGLMTETLLVCMLTTENNVHQSESKAVRRRSLWHFDTKKQILYFPLNKFQSRFNNSGMPHWNTKN